VHSVRSRGPVCPRPGPPRRIGAEEVDVPERFAEDCFWLDGLRGEDDGITVLDCFLFCDEEIDDATVLDLDLLGVIPTFSPRKIELITPSPKSNICVRRGSS
jgi:hypothetical protein